jgi:nucleoside-diphosphate-sugar epimerase
MRVPAVVDGLDREAVLAAVQAAAPEVIMHQMTALSDMRSLRLVDRVFATTNELRTRGTDNLLAAADLAGTRRFIAQSYVGANERSGGTVKTEEDPLDTHPIPSAARTLAAIKYVEQTEIADAAAATVAAAERGEPGVYKARKQLGWEPRYPSWREGFRAWVSA